MDYGQPLQPTNGGQAFFTAGAGTPLENENIFEAQNNLDTSSNGAASWGKSVERDPRGIGNSVLSSTREETNAPIELNENLKTSPDLTKTVDLAMPPSVNPEILQKEDQLPLEQFNRVAIKTEEKLSKSGIKEVDEMLNKFKQDSNPSSFYDSIRNMMETNLENSYNRKLGA